MTTLQFLYNQTNGNEWNWRPDYVRHGIPWNFTTISEQNPCNRSLPWQGVTCNKNESSITIILLPFYNLNGTIPTQIGQLSDLEGLDLNNNALTGTIPTQIGQLY